MVRRFCLFRAIGVLLGLGLVAPACAEPVRVYAAGSLSGALQEVIAASGVGAASPVFGPAGLLRERLSKGERADLFLSADLKGPDALAQSGQAKAVIPFARNRLCVLSREDLGLMADNLLDRLLDPKLRLATSKPHADPGGDYAFAAFTKADALRPGATKILEGKAMQLFGSPGAMVPVAGKSPAASVFLSNRADVLIYYCSGVGEVQRTVPGLASLPLPDALSTPITYGMAQLTDQPDGLRLALFFLSEKGQAILAQHGLIPVATP